MQSANFDFDPIDIITGGMVKTEKALDYFCGNDFRCLAQSTNFHPCFLRELRLRAGQLWVFRVLLGRQWLDDWTCSHRLRGLPSSSGSHSLLHLRALAPQRPVTSFRQGTVEPQPPPHACSVVAWPVARQGFYSGQPSGYPSSDPSRGRGHSPHAIATSSCDDRLDKPISSLMNILQR